MKLVKVVWDDALTEAIESWTDQDHISYRLARAEVVGWLALDTDRLLTVVSGKCMEHEGAESWGCVWNIPKPWVVELTELSEQNPTPH